MQAAAFTARQLYVLDIPDALQSRAEGNSSHRHNVIYAAKPPSLHACSSQFAASIPSGATVASRVYGNPITPCEF